MEQGRREMKLPPGQPSEDQQLNLPPPPPQKCPRCDSLSTKFCYYNNYSLSQPRYFCKNCRRYWTLGGTLRNVPVGGGCRRPKRVKTSSTAIGDGSRLQLPQPSSVAINYSNGGFSSMSTFAQPQPSFHVGSSSFSFFQEFNQQLPNQQQMDCYYQISNQGMVEPNRLLGFLNQTLTISNNNSNRSNPNQSVGTSLNFLPEFPGYDQWPSS